MAYIIKAELTPETSAEINSRISSLDYKKRENHYCMLLHAIEWNSAMVPIVLKQISEYEPFRIYDITQYGSAIVLLIDNHNHEYFRERNLEIKFSIRALEKIYEYNPHITIAYTDNKLTKQELSMLKDTFKDMAFKLSHETQKITSRTSYESLSK